MDYINAGGCFYTKSPRCFFVRARRVNRHWMKMSRQHFRVLCQSHFSRFEFIVSNYSQTMSREHRRICARLYLWQIVNVYRLKTIETNIRILGVVGVENCSYEVVLFALIHQRPFLNLGKIPRRSTFSL